MITTDTIKELAHSTTTASAVFLALAQRERSRHLINIDLLRSRLQAQGVKIQTTDFIAVFKKLDQLGAGKLVFGRRGNPSCFMWRYDLKDVAKMGLGVEDIRPKPAIVRPSRGVNVDTIPVIQTLAEPPKPNKALKKPAAKQASPKPPAHPKVQESVTKTFDEKKYVHVLIPVDMLKMIKT